MSKLYTCIGKTAQKPYSILSGKVNVYTLEEICFCICDRTDLLDDTFLSGGLAEFVRTQLGLDDLAQNLDRVLEQGCLLHEFCDMILSYAAYPDQGIRRKVVEQIRENQELSVVDRLVRRADTYHREKEYYKAQKAYRNLLLMEEVQQDFALTAQLYDKLGCVAAKMFHYETAGYCFEKSCRFVENAQVRKKYMLCMRLTMPREKYMNRVMQQEDCGQWIAEVEQAYETADIHAQQYWKDNTADMNQIKEEFCRMVLE